MVDTITSMMKRMELKTDRINNIINTLFVSEPNLVCNMSRTYSDDTSWHGYVKFNKKYLDSFFRIINTNNSALDRQFLLRHTQLEPKEKTFYDCYFYFEILLGV